MNYTVDVPAVQAVLMRVAAEAAALNEAANAAETAGGTAAALFGTAAEVSEAFTGFWKHREDVGQQVSRLVLRRADSVADAARAFAAADGEMTDTAGRALAATGTGYTARA